MVEHCIRHTDLSSCESIITQPIFLVTVAHPSERVSHAHLLCASADRVLALRLPSRDKQIIPDSPSLTQ
jgi:hypothetical protein